MPLFIDKSKEDRGLRDSAMTALDVNYKILYCIKINFIHKTIAKKIVF